MEDQKTIVEESDGDEIITPPTPEQKAEIEKLEEQKLKSKFPGWVTFVRSIGSMSRWVLCIFMFLNLLINIKSFLNDI